VTGGTYSEQMGSGARFSFLFFLTTMELVSCSESMVLLLLSPLCSGVDRL
jgi:hypothetical protein